MATLHVTVARVTSPTMHINPGSGSPFAAVNFATYDTLHFEDPAELREWAAVFTAAAGELEAAQRKASES